MQCGRRTGTLTNLYSFYVAKHLMSTILPLEIVDDEMRGLAVQQLRDGVGHSPAQIDGERVLLGGGGTRI